MSKILTIIMGYLVMTPVAYAQSNILTYDEFRPLTLEERREIQREDILAARASCARQLQSVPEADRLYYLMNECYKDNAHVFLPIGPVESPKPVNTGTPVFHPDPNRPNASR